MNARNAFRRCIHIAAHHYQATEILKVELNDVGIFSNVSGAGNMLDATRNIVQCVNHIKYLQNVRNYYTIRTLELEDMLFALLPGHPTIRSNAENRLVYR